MFLHLLQQAYSKVPDWLDRYLVRSANTFRAAIPQRLSGWRVSGTTQDQAQPLTAQGAGRAISVDYHLATLFAETPTLVPAGDLAPSRACENMLGSREAQLLIVRCERRRVRSAVAARFWQVPDAVASVVDLSGGALPDQRGNADNLRRIRRFELTAEVSHAPEDFSDFYQNYYVPYATARFGSTAIVRSEIRLARHFRAGGLLWVKRGGERLAGTIFTLSLAECRSWVAAPLPDSADAKKVGALASIYKFLTDLAIESGSSRLHLGMCRSQLLDGILVHKKHWGASVISSPDVVTDLFVTWSPESQAILSWLARAPLIVRDGEGLAALTAPPSVGIEALQRHVDKMASPGLRRILVVTGSSSDVTTTASGIPVQLIAPELASGQGFLG